MDYELPGHLLSPVKSRGVSGDSMEDEKQSRLYIIHPTLKVANEFVRRFHRHNKPVPGSKINLALLMIKVSYMVLLSLGVR